MYVFFSLQATFIFEPAPYQQIERINQPPVQRLTLTNVNANVRTLVALMYILADVFPFHYQPSGGADVHFQPPQTTNNVCLLLT